MFLKNKTLSIVLVVPGMPPPAGSWGWRRGLGLVWWGLNPKALELPHPEEQIQQIPAPSSERRIRGKALP